MSPDEFKYRMENILATHADEAFENSMEERHRAADILMCEALRKLGYGGGIDIFEEMPKWYA